MPLSNIPQDVYALFQDGIDSLPKEKVDELSRNISTTISKKLKMYGRDFTHKPDSVFRMSNIGKPLRLLWYAYRDPDRFKINSSQLKLLMLYGDIIEEILLFLIKQAGYKVEGEQDLLVLEGYNGARARGKRDAKINGVNSDFKSMSPFSFNKFKTEAFAKDKAADPYGYKPQVVSYSQADSKKPYAEHDEYAALIGMNKSSGELHVLHIDPLSQEDMRKRVDEVEKAVKSETRPPRCYDDVPDGKSGNRKLHQNCVGCKYKKDCWSDVNKGKGLRVFMYSNGPRYLTEVKNLPTVDEIEVKEW